MDRDQFLTWARAMLAARIGAQPVQQVNNVQHGGFVSRVGIGIVANIQPPGIRVHLFTYDLALSARWRRRWAAGAVGVPVHRVGDRGNVEYLEFSMPVTWPISGAALGALQRQVTGCVDYFVAAQTAGQVP